jgi:hypothetical protein
MAFAHVLGLGLFLIGLRIMLTLGRWVGKGSLGFSFRGFGLFVTALVIACGLTIGFFILLLVVNDIVVTVGWVSNPSDVFSGLIWLVGPPIAYALTFGIGASQGGRDVTDLLTIPAPESQPQAAEVPACERATQPPFQDLRVGPERGAMVRRYIPTLVILFSPLLALLSMHALSWSTGVAVGGMDSIGFPRLLFALSIWGSGLGWFYAVPFASLAFVIAWLTSDRSADRKP